MLSMYQELFNAEPELTKILVASYDDIITVNKWLVLYFQQNRKQVFSLTRLHSNCSQVGRICLPQHGGGINQNFQAL